MKNKKPITYVTRDKERGMGIPEQPGIYTIITDTRNPTPTHALLKDKKVQKQLDNMNADIVVFKNTVIIEKICREQGWSLLNPPAHLAQEIEDKISQIHWLDELTSLLPSFFISDTKDIDFDGTPFILQYNRAHTGSGTYHITSQQQLDILKKKFPDRPAKISTFIDGPVYTCNIVVSPTNIVFGNISYQITGITPFTNNQFATIGNDWRVADTILKENQKDQIKSIGMQVAKKMQSQHWRGLFGIDIIIDQKTDIIYLLEINARQPASTTFESILQTTHGNPTLFETHLMALLGQEIKSPPVITSGAQLLVRNTPDLMRCSPEKKNQLIAALTELGHNITTYNNTKEEQDMIRIQTDGSFVSSPGQLNEAGQAIKTILLNYYEIK